MRKGLNFLNVFIEIFRYFLQTIPPIFLIGTDEAIKIGLVPILEASRHKSFLVPALFKTKRRTFLHALVILIIFFFLQQTKQPFFLLIKMVLGQNHSFLHLHTHLFGFLPSPTVLQSSLLLLLFVAHQPQTLGILRLLFLISLHKIEDVNGIHIQAGQICRRLHLLLHRVIQGISFGLSLVQQILDFCLADGFVSGFEYGTGSVLQHLFHFLLGECLVFVGCFLLLNYQIIPLQFYHLPFYNLLLNRVFRNESIDSYKFFLADTVCAVHRLQVHLGIEVAIIQNNCIGCCQVDPEATSTRAQQKEEMLVRGHKGFDLVLSAFHVRASIDSAIAVVSQMTKIFKNVQKRSHLREDKHFVITFFVQFAEQFVQNDHFARSSHYMLAYGRSITGLHIGKKIRMTANFSQLH